LHERAPAIVGALRGDRLLGHAESREILLRDVDASLAPVHLDVLPEIDLLQRRADGIGLLARIAASFARVLEHVQHETADGIGGAA
jgi:hypothetical protein